MKTIHNNVMLKEKKNDQRLPESISLNAILVKRGEFDGAGFIRCTLEK